ncbi:MAG: hypothetical protein SF182_28355 [Deltaproteobacteria bacterium]|nr:hypothetical protein [Deltaproteobacteria bacterium]
MSSQPATATVSASQTVTATAVPTATPTARATFTATGTGTATASPTNSATASASATASDTPTRTATATPSDTPTASPTPTAAFCGSGEPIPHIHINPGLDGDEQIPVRPEDAAPGQCLAQTINQGGCRALQDLDGSNTTYIDAGDSVDPRACTVEQTALSYHWQIFWPPLFESRQYASAGITGYFLPVLTIESDSLPSLDDTISATDPYWRISLTVTPLPRDGEAMTPAPRTVWFRVHYVQTQLTTTQSAQCNPVVTMSCPGDMVNAYPPTESY